MRSHPVILLLLLSFLFSSTTVDARSQPIEELLKKRLPDAKIKRLANRAPYQGIFEIRLRQPLDHKNEAAGYFEQLLYLSHYDYKKPMVIVTEGYSANNRTTEVAKMLDANQLVVEYRYAGVSKPAKMDWQYLTSDQATEDLHRIRRLFRKIYRKDWISTGISKGGTTTLVYKAKYPKDVCVAIPYVAPLAFAQEDERTDIHQAQIGPEACRQDIKDFQRLALSHRAKIIPMIDTFAANHGYSFTIGTDAAFEYAVLEYPFSFWQWGANCEEIPDETASQQEIFDYLNNVVGWNFYSDAIYDYFLPSFYQFLTELGYYGFPKDHVEDLLVAVKNPTNLTFGPRDADLTFKPYLVPVNDWLMKKGHRILYIYGELDTWTACGVVPSPKTDALRMVKEGGSHSTRIKDFSKEEQQKIYDKLKKWLKVPIKPLATSG
ncbi:MAG: S28 family serine protease [Bacteroidota bacterium]